MYLNEKNSVRAVRLALSVLTGSMLLHAHAEDVVKKEEPAPQKVEITGSKIKRVNAETASPVQIISRDEMVRGGATSLSEVLKQVSSNLGGISDTRQGGFTSGASSMNLRGIGSQATLMLINGRRLAAYAQPEFQTTFVDLNSLPIGAVERIEILKDGASAIYGSEAIAGVVNIILRDSFQGVETEASYGQSERNDGQQQRASISYGFGSLVEDHFNAYATLDVRQRKPMFLNRRDDYLSTQDLRQWGYKDGRSLYTYPGNIYWTDKTTGKFVSRSLDNNCPANRQVPGSAMFGAGATGTACVFDDFRDGDYNSAGKTDRIGLTSRATWQINADTTAFAEVIFNQNKSLLTGNYHWVAGQNGQIVPALPITHPQYPKDLIDPVTGKTLAGGNGTVRVRASLKDFPGQGQDVTTDFGRYLVGAKGAISNWDWESALMYNSSEVTAKSSSGILTTPFINAYKNGTFIFGGSAKNADLYRQIVTDSESSFKSDMTLWDAKVTGELMKLPAGALMMAGGVEARRESLTITPSPLAVAGELYHTAQADPGFSRSRNIASAYTELSIPIIKDLEAQFAVRYDHYSDYGNSTTPKLGLRYNATPELLLRGTYAGGFRAPTLVENSAQIKKAYLSFSDPARCNASFKEGCQSSSAYESGSNPDLKPETAKSFTLGAVWEPTTWLNASVDFWQIQRDNEISTYDLATVLANPGRYAGNPAAVITRDPLTPADQAAGATAGEITNVRMLLTNVAMTRVNGVDVDLRGNFNMGQYGKLKPRLQMTYTNSYKTAPAPDAEPVDFIGSRNQPRLVATLGTGWEKAAWTASADVYYVGHMSSIGDFSQPCQFIAEGYPGMCGDIPSFTTVNLGGSYSGFAKNLKVSLAVQNAFDRKPPFAAPTSGGVAFSSLHDPMGRYFQLTVAYKFK